MSLPLKWEFPGGKVELGESPDLALLREIREELNILVQIVSPLSPTIHEYDTDKKIRLIPYLCTILDSQIPSPTEHAQTIWKEMDTLLELDWAEADLPIVFEIMKYHL